MSEHYYSFCGKSQGEVAQLIAGPGNFICDECVEMCMLIVLEHRGKTRETKFEALASPVLPDLKKHVNENIDLMIARLNTARIY